MTHAVRHRMCGWLFVCGLSLFAVPDAAVAQPAPPVLTAPVNDFADVIDESNERELDRRIRALESASGDVVVVATVKTFQPYGDIREYAVKMFENGGRGIGERGKDNGVLIVVAVDDLRVDIEVGYSLEEFITDGFAGETIRQSMAPHFKRRDYGAGLLEGATRIINRIAERRGVTLQDVPRAGPAPEKIVALSVLDHHPDHPHHSVQSRRRRPATAADVGWRTLERLE